MDQDSLDFNIKLNDEQTIPDIDSDAKKQEQIQRESYSSQNTRVSQASSLPEPTSQFDLKAAAHPGMCLVTFVFKALAIFCYFFLNAIMDDKIYTFIVVLILSCVDFWAVKNLTARFLVGLRWSNQFDEDGKETWVYESMPVNWEAHKVDKSIFWFSQFIATIFFSIMLVLKILTFDPFWGLLNIMCMVLYGTNLYGFYKCRGEHQKKGKQLMGKIGLKVLTGGF